MENKPKKKEISDGGKKIGVIVPLVILALFSLGYFIFSVSEYQENNRDVMSSPTIPSNSPEVAVNSVSHIFIAIAVSFIAFLITLFTIFYFLLVK